MKTDFLVILVFFSIHTLTIFGQPGCPTGFSETYRSYTINGCEVSVRLCYNCSVGTSDFKTLYIFGWGKVNSNCEFDPPLNDSEANYAVRDAVINTPNLVYELCGDPFPPCTTSAMEVQLEFDICWQKYNNSGNIWYHPCWQGRRFCYELWKICWDPVLGQITELIAEGGPSGQVYCTTPWYDVEDPSLGEESECFYFET